MNKIFKLISLIILFSLNFSCAEKKLTENEPNNSELMETSKTDTLKFIQEYAQSLMTAREITGLEVMLKASVFIMENHLNTLQPMKE